MAEAPVRPRPCTDPDCRGRHAPRERVALAVSICEARGERMTAFRRRILELLWANGRPTGAYELIEAIELRDSRRVGPPTVYRALEFLMAQGLVSRIESLNAYVPCVHPEREHDCLFFICSGCRISVELEDPRIEAGRKPERLRPVRPSRARTRLPVLHLQRLPDIGRARGPPDRRTARRGCRPRRVRRDTPHGRGRGRVRAVRGSRRGVGGTPA